MLWTVRHHLPMGERFALSFYKHWVNIPIHRPGKETVKFHTKEGVTQGDTLSMVLYGITLAPLKEELRVAYRALMAYLYVNVAEF